MGSIRSIFLLVVIIQMLMSSLAFSQNNTVASIPFTLNNDHIIIKINLNGSGDLNFLFDSGAGGTLISKSVVDSLGFKKLTTRKNVGVSGAHEVDLIKGVKLSVQGKKLGNISLLSTNTHFEELDNGQKVDGVIGYPILSKYVVEINYANNLIKLYHTSSYSYSGEGKVVPLYLVYNLPIADANFSLYNKVVIKGNFLMDTGARSDVIISAPTVVKYELAENIGDFYTVRKRIGSSGRRTKLRYGRLASLEIAGYDFKNIPVALSSDDKGILANPSFDGIIGNRLLKRFNVIFDYEHKVLYLEPSILMGSNYTINASGFNLVFKSGKPYITNVIDRSPADKAGLKSGDEIISINTILVANLTSTEIREYFKKPGNSIEIVIKRNKKLKYTKFTLKSLI